MLKWIIIILFILSAANYKGDYESYSYGGSGNGGNKDNDDYFDNYYYQQEEARIRQQEKDDRYWKKQMEDERDFREFYETVYNHPW